MAQTYAVTLDNQGATSSGTTLVSATYGSAMLSITPPTKNGYTFNGYFADVNGIGIKYYTNTGASNNNWDQYYDTTIYAAYTGNQYTLIFNANGGSGTMSNQNINFGQSASLTANAFTRTGYNFDGWATSVGGAKVYNNSASYTMNTEGAALYAVWTAKTYAVTFNANGGSGTMSNQNITFGQSANLTANSFTRTGYDFDGWATSAGDVKLYDNSASYTMNTEGATLYAVWTAKTYAVTFDSNGGSGTISNQNITFGQSANLTANAFTRTGYDFDGWATSAGGAKAYNNSASYTMSTEGATLYAVWTVKTYAVTFDANGGSTASPTSIQVAYGSTYGTLATTSRTGHTFDGWYTASTGGTKVESTASVTTTSNHTLYAQWAANNYNITFNDNGGTGGWGPTPMAYGAPLLAPTVTRAGYTFKFWGPAVPSTVPAADAIYNAVWTINKYTVSFNSNGGSAVAPITQDYNSSVAKPTPDPTKTNFTFAGWYSDQGLTNAVTWPYTLGAVNVTFYAKWTGNAHTITFDANGGSGGWSNSMNFGDTITVPTVTRPGYAFTGWQPSPPPTVGGTATYTAQWDETIVGATLVNDDLVINIVGWAADYSYQIWTYQQITSDTLLDDTSGVQVNQWILSQPYTLGSAGASGAGASINFTIDGTFTSPNKNYTIAVRIIDENGDYLAEMRDSYTPAAVDESEITKVLVDGEYVRGSSQEDIDKNIKSTVLKEITPSAAPVIKVIGNLSGMTYTAMVVETSQVLTANGNEFAWDISGYIPQRYTVRVTASNGTSTDTLDILFMLYSSSASVQYGTMNSLSLTNGVSPLTVPQVIGINTNFSNGNFHYVVREMGRAANYTSASYTDSGNIPHEIEEYGIYSIFGYANRAIMSPSESNYDDGIIKDIVIKRSNSPSSMTISANPSYANPIAKGTPITITASASIAGIGATPVEYSFWRYDAKGYVLIKDWSSDDELAWTPGRVGIYTIQVRAKGADAGSYEVRKDIEVNITDTNQQIAQGVLITVNTAELNLNAQARTPITIKASATGTNGNDLLYRFFVSDEAMGSRQLQAYSPNEECIWTPRKAFTYTITVQVKNEASFGKWDEVERVTVVVD